MAIRTPVLQPNILMRNGWRGVVIVWKSELFLLVTMALFIAIGAYTFLVNAPYQIVNTQAWQSEKANCEETAKAIPGTVWDDAIGCVNRSGAKTATPRHRPKAVVTKIDESRWFLALAALASPWQCGALGLAGFAIGLRGKNND